VGDCEGKFERQYLMKRAIGLIAATLVTASVYSQDYSSSSSQDPDSTPPDYQSRQSEAGAPASADSSSSSSSGYEVSPSTSGGNSLTGQSNGANVQGDQGEDKTLTTRDSDVSGSEYRGTLENESQQSFDAELSTDSSASGSSGSSVSGSASSDSDTETLKGTGTADGAFHEPAAPVREGSESEGWSGSGTFSGAGPGSVGGSASSSASVDVQSNSSSLNYSSSPSTVESTSSFDAEVSGNAALSERDEDLRSRGLEPDSGALSRDEAFSNRVEGDLEGDMDRDNVLIFEDWTIVEPDSSVGGPAGSDSGSSSSSDADNRHDSDVSASGSIGASSSDSSASYNDELYYRVQRDWSARTGTTDMPAIPNAPAIMDHELDHLRFHYSDPESDVGAPGRSESGVKSSDDDIECETNKGSSAEFEQGELDNSVSSDYHINRGDDEKYHINRSESSESSAPSEYGDRATDSNYDDGHLNGNNAAGNSAESESGTSSSEEGALNQPDL
jgi:hypothetical protein